MEISNPRRILFIGPPDSQVLTLIQSLTGSAPVPQDSSTAGLSHIWHVSTPYYTVDLPIWIDEIIDLSAWSLDFSTPEASEVISALGAWVYVFRKPITEAEFSGIKEAMKTIKSVVEKGAGEEWDGVRLAVAMGQSVVPYLEKGEEEWEDVCLEFGFEFVDGEGKGKNEFGEAKGVQRVREALEANEWEGDDGGGLDDALDLGDDDGEEGFNTTFDAEEAEMNMELYGMKNAIQEGQDNAESQKPVDEGKQVEEMERMMQKLQVIKDMGSDVPEAERKRLAARAVNDIMKSF